jgi:hypothetical protein
MTSPSAVSFLHKSSGPLQDGGLLRDHGGLLSERARQLPVFFAVLGAVRRSERDRLSGFDPLPS